MKYLTIIPNYTGSCIQDDFNGQIEAEELRLPKEYIDAIALWHRSYKAIIPLNEIQRNASKDEIIRLDKEGLELAKKLSRLVAGGAKVKYYSEGLMQYLPVM